MDNPSAAAKPVVGRHAFNSSRLMVCASLILFIYVLSMGPFLRFAFDGRIGYPLVDILDLSFRPWGWAYNETPLHKPLGMYLHLWVPDYFDRKGEWVTPFNNHVPDPL